MNNIIHIKNEWHLGDNIFTMIMFSKIKEYIENNNIFINYYCLSEHIKQIKEFNYSNNIIIIPLTEMNTNEKIIDSWTGSEDYEYNYFSFLNEKDVCYDTFMKIFFNNILKLLNIPIEIKDFIFENDDFIEIQKNINIKTNNKYNNIDILIVNGNPLSKQIDYNLEEWNNIIKLFDKKYNIVTTQKVENIKCTRDDDLSAKEIGAISIKVKKIIAIDSGVSISFYNKYTIQNVETIYYLHRTHFCCFSNFVKKNNIDELLFLLDDNKIEKMQNIYSEERNIIYIFIFLILILILFLYYIILFKHKNIYKNIKYISKYLKKMN